MRQARLGIQLFMTYRDNIESNTYLRNEWNNDRSWFNTLSSTRVHRTRIEYGLIVRYKLSNFLGGMIEAFSPVPCC
jgi:hypothetical protein